VCHRGATSVANARSPRDLGFRRSEFGALFTLFGGGFGLCTRRFFSAQDRHARGLGAFRLGSRGFLLRGSFGSGLRCGSFSGGMLLSGGLHVGRLTATTDRRVVGDDFGNRRYFRRNGCRGAAATSRRRRCGLLFCAGALFPFPASADASDLVVGEHAHVAADRNVHEPKKGDHFFGWNSEFVCQLTD
jgi:hypothetical protein